MIFWWLSVVDMEDQKFLGVIIERAVSVDDAVKEASPLLLKLAPMGTPYEVAAFALGAGNDPLPSDINRVLGADEARAWRPAHARGRAN